MKNDLLDQVLDFEQNKDSFSLEVRVKIRKQLLKEVNKKLKKIGTAFISSIEDINSL